MYPDVVERLLTKMGLLAIVFRLFSDILESKMPPSPNLSSIDTTIVPKNNSNDNCHVNLRVLSLNVWGKLKLH